MRRTLGFAVLGVSAVLGGGLRGADDKGKPDETIVLPGKSVYATGSYDTAIPVQPSLTAEEKQVFGDIYKLARRTGPSNVFLVRGANLGEAVRMTAAAFAPFL